MKAVLSQKKLLAILCALIVLMFSLVGCDEQSTTSTSIPKAPSLEKPVVDETGTLSKEDITAISREIGNSQRDKEQPQIAVLMVNRVPAGKTVESASLEVARAWGVGNKDKKNGVLFYIAKNDHEMRFEVADGVSDKLTDLTSDRILEEVVAPQFKNKAYAAGIEKGVQSVRAVVGGKNVDEVVGTDTDLGTQIAVWVLVGVAVSLVLFVFGFVMVSRFVSKESNQSGYYAGTGGYYGANGYYGSSSGSSYSGGSFGGGGGFSGGGASSSW